VIFETWQGTGRLSVNAQLNCRVEQILIYDLEKKKIGVILREKIDD